MDLSTILRAINLVGDVTPAAMALYQGFIADTKGEDQAELKRRHADAQARSDHLHRQLQAELGARQNDPDFLANG